LTDKSRVPGRGVKNVQGEAMKSWVYLMVAIVAEIVGTSGLKASDGFSKLWPSLLTVAGYGTSFFFLSLTLRTIPMSVAYAVWSGVGIVLITLVGWIFFGQRLDLPAMIGIAIIALGVVVLNLFSKTLTH
jgi:small multidrug resistance pump